MWFTLLCGALVQLSPSFSLMAGGQRECTYTPPQRLWCGAGGCYTFSQAKGEVEILLQLSATRQCESVFHFCQDRVSKAQNVAKYTHPLSPYATHQLEECLFKKKKRLTRIQSLIYNIQNAQYKVSYHDNNQEIYDLHDKYN